METDNAVMAKDNHVRACLRGRKRNLGQFFWKLENKVSIYKEDIKQKGAQRGVGQKGIWYSREKRNKKRLQLREKKMRFWFFMSPTFTFYKTLIEAKKSYKVNISELEGRMKTIWQDSGSAKKALSNKLQHQFLRFFEIRSL